jgi:hypothetical protein
MPRTLLAFNVLAIVLGLAATLLVPSTSATEALCSTDTECMALCPADDAGCDGGPES